MNKVALLFGIHLHQPVDNFSFCIQEAVEKSYMPFFETMSKHSDFKFSVHCSGWLLEQIQANYPKLFEMMKKLTQNGAIEWFSAGYYEPVLSSIPSKDRRVQIEKLNAFLEANFGVKAKGLWLTERVWESSLVPDIASCGIEYSVVDDYHFLSSGFSKDNLDGFYVTEEGGDENALFPISKKLRYVLPFSNVDKAIETILSYAQNPNSAAIFFDDAEKFGLWPNTYDWVYAEGWLENFVTAVLENENIQTMHFQNFKKDNRSKGIAYLNNTSYVEMGEWSLDAHKAQHLRALKQQVGDEYFEDVGVALIKGGIWKNFFVKYSESNYLHKRMLQLSSKSASFSQKQKDSLYRLQTNDVFWHGVFGGIYLPNLRDNAYKYLLQEKETFDNKFEVLDIDKDGYDELHIKTDSLSLVFSSKYGGQMVEFGSFETLFNWQNTMTRRLEIYHMQDEKHGDKEQIDSIHDGVAMDEQLRSELHFDPSPRYSFIDHFTTSKIDLESFKKSAFDDIGDFSCHPFELNSHELCFARQGKLTLEKPYSTNLQKRYNCQSKSINLDVSFESDCKEQLYYSCELNLHFAHLFDVTINGEKVGDGISQYALKEFKIYDDFTNKLLVLQTNTPCDLHSFVVSTISKSEQGFDKTPQHISLILTMPIDTNTKPQIKLEQKNV